MTWLRAFLVWLVIIGVESVHGFLRIKFLASVLGDFGARQVSVFTGGLLIFGVAWLFIRWLRAVTTRSLIAIGVGWVVLTLLFEIGLGRLVFDYSWQRILSDYDLTKGGLMSLGVVFLILAPLLAARLRGLRPAFIEHASARPPAGGCKSIPAASSTERAGCAIVLWSFLATNAITLGWIAVAVTIASLLVWWRFDSDIRDARTRSALASVVVQTRCGPIEYAEAGQGVPLLMIHGSGGGQDQGMAWARPLVQDGVRVIAMSRFGYLRTPRPADASPEAQADAHVCLLDALGIAKAAVMGVSAGGPSAMQTAIRHPDRVSALVLVVPIAYKPDTVADSAPPVSDDKDALLLRLLGSDFLFWTGLHVARDPLIRHVLATPPEQVAAASERERARVNDLADRILPVSSRAAGLRDDTRLGKRLSAYALESIRVPTLVVSARDDGFGTYAAAQYTAGRIAGAKFIGYERGGHLLIGHDEEIRREIVKLLITPEKP